MQIVIEKQKQGIASIITSDRPPERDPVLRVTRQLLRRAALTLSDHFEIRANRKYAPRGAFACRHFPGRRLSPHISTLGTDNSAADKLSFRFDAELPLVLVEHFITFDIKCRKIIINVFDKALIYRWQRFFLRSGL